MGKAFDGCSFLFDSITNQDKTQKMCCRVVLKLLLFVCTPQYKKVYWGNHTTGSLVQDIYTNTIEHFEVCATRFIEKAIYIPHMGVQNITITVHSYSPWMGVHYIANTGSLIQDIFTNIIEHFENCATRFIEKKTIYIPHMGVQSITITVHSY